jgi:hypothetical protein
LKKLAVVIVLVCALFAMSAPAAEWKGWIVDAKCAAKGANAGHAACAEKCAKGGAALVFVTDGRVLKVAQQDKVQGHAGHEVTITGKLDGDTVSVDSVKM